MKKRTPIAVAITGLVLFGVAALALAVGVSAAVWTIWDPDSIADKITATAAIVGGVSFLAFILLAVLDQA